MLCGQVQKNSISLLGVCSGLGQKLQGMEEGPKVLRQNGICDIFLSESNFIDLGDLTPKITEDLSGWDLIGRIRAKALESLQSGHKLFTLGGDHSIAIGTVQATLAAHPTSRVIWVDAHGDINTPQTSLSGNLHGMPLAALLGLFNAPIRGPKLSPKKLLTIGVRDLDPAERIFFEKFNIEVITADEVLSKPEDVFKKITSWVNLEPDAPVHLSFDIDALDPVHAPATGLRVPSGLSLDFSCRLVSQISAMAQIVSMDLVELNPLRAESQDELFQTIESTKSILSAAFKAKISNLDQMH